MKKHTIAILATLVAGAIVAAICWPRRSIFPVDSASAKRSLYQSLARQRVEVDDERVVEISTDGTWVSNAWVFAEKNLEQPLLGGPAFEKVFLVGTFLGAMDGGPTRSRYVTRDFEEAFASQINLRPPRSASNALFIARCYAWLDTQTRPGRLKVLDDASEMSQLTEYLARYDKTLAESVREQIRAPHVEEHRTAPENRPLYTVEMCTHSPDFWGDIYFWHMEIGTYTFSVSKRPIYYAPRVME